MSSHHSVLKSIRFPEEVLKEIRPVMNKEHINFTEFIMQAVRTYIRATDFTEKMNNSFGAWKSNVHSELKVGVDHYIRKMRKGRNI